MMTNDMTMAERDAKIMEQIRSGVKLRDIADAFHLTEPRIYQIRKRELAAAATAEVTA